MESEKNEKSEEIKEEHVKTKEAPAENIEQTEEVQGNNGFNNFNQNNFVPNNQFGPNMPNQFSQANGYGQIPPNQFGPANYNMGSNYNPNVNKNNSFIFTIIGIIACVVVVMVAFGIIIFKSIDKDISGTSTSNYSDVANTSSSKINFQGYSLDIPSNLQYEIDSTYLYIGDYSGNWQVTFEFLNSNYDAMKGQMDKIKPAFESLGYSATYPQIKTVSGVEFITSELTYSGEKAFGAYTKVNEANLLAITGQTQNSTIDYSILDKIAPVVKSISVGSSATNIDTKVKIENKKIIDSLK